MQSKKDLNDLYQLFIVIQQNALAGISITDALDMYGETSPRPKIKRILKEVRADMERGIKMPAAFAKHPDFFPDYIVEMMKVNEGTGQSDDIYNDIVKTLEQQIDLRRNVGSQMGQMIFLGIVLLLTIGVVIFLVLPSMGKLMMGTGMKLPWYTKLMIDIGNFAKDYWFIIIGALVGAGASAKIAAKKNPRGLERLILKRRNGYDIRCHVISSSLSSGINFQNEVVIHILIGKEQQDCKYNQSCQYKKGYEKNGKARRYPLTVSSRRH